MKVKSSMILEVDYDEETQTLTVFFHDGSEYQYADVPKATANALVRAKSVGKFFLQNIRNQFRTRQTNQSKFDL